MMLSSWVINPMRYSSDAWPTKTRTMSNPRAIRTMCCLKRPSLGSRNERESSSAFDEELHLYARELDHVVVVESMSLLVQRTPIDGRKARTFDMGDEVSLR